MKENFSGGESGRSPGLNNPTTNDRIIRARQGELNQKIVDVVPRSTHRGVPQTQEPVLGN